MKDFASSLDMARRFPMNAASIVLGHRHRDRSATPADWLRQASAARPDLPVEAAAEAALVAQLGRRLGPTSVSLDDEPNAVRRLGLRLLSAYSLGYDIGEKLLSLNKSAADSDGDLPHGEADSLHHVAGPVLERCCRDHAWSGTMALAVIDAAKTANGVLPSAHFMWLRRDDPMLYALLNGYGRPSPVAGVLGVVAQWQAEKLMQCPLAEPYLGPAAAALLRSAV